MESSKAMGHFGGRLANILGTNTLASFTKIADMAVAFISMLTEKYSTASGRRVRWMGLVKSCFRMAMS